MAQPIITFPLKTNISQLILGMIFLYMTCIIADPVTDLLLSWFSGRKFSMEDILLLVGGFWSLFALFLIVVLSGNKVET